MPKVPGPAAIGAGDGDTLAALNCAEGQVAVRNAEGVWACGDSEAGAPGQDGVSITTALINQDGHLILTLSDDSTIDAGMAQGATAPEVWMDQPEPA